LITDLKAKRLYIETNSEADSWTEYVFIALPESIELALKNQDVILVDNIYKTNKYKMLLLYIVSK
jgi:hypothetical protein